MTDFGGQLRQARERRGISLRQIAATTKISAAVLEALERNDVSKLPGGIFSRAFVRSYATEVGLDPDETVREFLDLFEHRQAEETAVRQPPMSDEESAFESDQRMAGVVLKLVLVAIPLVGAILYFSFRSRSAPSPSEPQPTHAAAAPTPGQPDLAQPSTAIQADETQPSPPGAAPVTSFEIATPPVLRAAAGGAGSQPSAAQEGTALDLHPTGACWVSVTVDGRRAFAKVMQPGERGRFVVKTEAVVEVGDAGAFAYSLNGKEQPSIGAAGQVKTLRVTAPAGPR